MSAELLRAENTHCLLLGVLLLLLYRIMFKLPKLRYSGFKCDVCQILMICVKFFWTPQTSAWKCLTAPNPCSLGAWCGYAAAQAVLPSRKLVGFLDLCQECESSESEEKCKMNVSVEMTLWTARKGKITTHTHLCRVLNFQHFRAKLSDVIICQMFAFPCGFQGAAPMHFCLS